MTLPRPQSRARVDVEARDCFTDSMAVRYAGRVRNSSNGCRSVNHDSVDHVDATVRGPKSASSEGHSRMTAWV
jgi:hypothetical protein